MDRTGVISFPTCHGVEVSVALVSLPDVAVALRGYVILKGRLGGMAELSRYKLTLTPANGFGPLGGVTLFLHRVVTVCSACCPLGSFKEGPAFQNSAIIRPVCLHRSWGAPGVSSGRCCVDAVESREPAVRSIR